MVESIVRDMQADDCSDVSRVQCASFRWAAKHEGFKPQQIADYFGLRGSEDAVRIQFREYRCLVACIEGSIVGVIGIKGNVITKLYVDPSYLRRGIGKALFQSAEDLIANEGHQDLTVVTIFPDTVPFYKEMDMCESCRKIIEHGPMTGVESVLLRKSLAVNI